MTTTDTIALASALAAAFSAAVAIAAVIVAWLARKDSKRLADAAQKANELMVKQLELASSEQNLRLQKERSDSLPIFNWGSGAYSPGLGFCEWEFENLGEMVTDLQIQSGTLGISASVNPVNRLLNKGHGKIRFEFPKLIAGDLGMPIAFTISCVTKLDEGWAKNYQLAGARAPGRIVEI
jgi:hypothetical protein